MLINEKQDSGTVHESLILLDINNDIIINYYKVRHVRIKNTDTDVVRHHGHTYPDLEIRVT